MIGIMKTVDELLADFNLEPVEIKSGLATRVLMIGPKEAEALLRSNHDNRALRPGRVKYYAKTMSQGNWKLTHQGLAFSESGKGLDLQHRLNAVIQSGITAPFMVVEGLSDDAFEAIDQHERRTAADALKLPRVLIEEARFFIALQGGTANGNSTLREVGEMASEIEHDSSKLTEACPTRRAIYASVSMRCAAILLMLEKPKSTIEILQKYRNFVLQKTEEWSSSMHAFGRQAAAGKLLARDYKERADLFARGLIALDPASNDLLRIQVNDAEVVARQRVKKMFD